MPDERFWTNEIRTTVIERVGHKVWGYLHGYSRQVDYRSILDGLGKLRHGDFDRLVAQRVLLQSKVRRFVEIDGHDLLRALAKSTEIVLQSGHGTLRGPIDWQQTFAMRALLGSLEGPVFVWRSAERRYDLPENRLLKLLIRRLDAACDRVLSGGQDQIRPTSWRRSVVETKGLCAAILAHALMRQVADVEVLAPTAWTRSRNHRIEGYRTAADLLEWLDGAYERQSQINRELLSRDFLVPLDDDTLFELFVLTKLIDALVAEDWRLTSLRTIHGVGGPLFAFKKDDARCYLRYQSVPDQLAESSHYKKLLESASIDPTTRRPDIVVVMSRQDTQWTGLVEVKLSERRQYMLDGIYKVLAYMRDFAQILDQRSGPKAILVTWNGPSYFNRFDDVGLITANQMTAQMRPFVRAALEAIS